MKTWLVAVAVVCGVALGLQAGSPASGHSVPYCGGSTHGSIINGQWWQSQYGGSYWSAGMHWHIYNHYQGTASGKPYIWRHRIDLYCPTHAHYY